LAVEVIESVRRERPDLILSIVDITQAPELAVKYRVMATPAIAINGRLAFMGVPRRDALRDAVLSCRA